MIRAVIKWWGHGFPPPTMNVGPGYFHRKIEKKNRTKRNPYLSDFTPSCCI